MGLEWVRNGKTCTFSKWWNVKGEKQAGAELCQAQRCLVGHGFSDVWRRIRRLR